MRDLLVITPTRGRPERALRLASAIHRTATAKTDLCFAFDDDDETMAETMAVAETLGDNVMAMHGSRQGLGPWTNQIAQAQFGNYRAFASFGDDHVPKTLSWDRECLAALDHMGGGFVVPNGRMPQETGLPLPEQVVISANIVEALGWMCLPGLDHWYVDRVWSDLGSYTHRLPWLELTRVEHWQDPSDSTGTEAWGSIDRDRVVYASWLLEGFPGDLETVRKALEP